MADVLSYDDLLKEFRKLAKRADQRLVRIEQAGKTNIGAYRGAMQRISQFSSGGTRFNVKVPKNIRSVRARIGAVREFLAMETSTAKGRKALYKRIRDTIRNDYGLDLKNDDQLEAIFEGELWSDMNARYGSNTAIQILATVQKNPEDIKDAILASSDKYYASEEDASDAEEIIGKFIDDADIKEIFGSNKP